MKIQDWLRLLCYVHDNKTLGFFFFDSSSHLVMDGHMSRVFSVQYTPGQDHEFLSGGWDDTVQVINRS